LNHQKSELHKLSTGRRKPVEENDGAKDERKAIFYLFGQRTGTYDRRAGGMPAIDVERSLCLKRA
jgi:hypothetical protein